MEEHESPYKCHLFVCIKSRGGERKSCGDGDNATLKAVLKAEIRNRGWKELVRISESGCLGLCGDGPNIMIHPQQIWLSAVTLADIPGILQTLEDIVQRENAG
jgi:(2Fe-2S) ferredoxin